MNDRQYSLYIVRCADGSLYTGIAIDVAKRVLEHDGGTRGAKYLRGKGPLQLVYQQSLGDRVLASQIEYRVKRLDKMRKQLLVTGQASLTELLADVD